MTYLLDTNILIHLIRGNEVGKLAEKFIQNAQQVVISVVSIGEMKSIAIQRKWSENRMKTMQNLFDRFLVADIHTEEIVDKYAEIDAFSQGKHPNLLLSTSSRNMGKNDIWIAATAAVYELILLTTDQDFSHLGNTFLKLQLVQIL